MSREIKFRAKVLNSNNWIYRQPFHIRGTWYMYNSLWDKVKIDYKTLGQYTGLKDKNGKEIYEGDILEAEHKLKTQKFKRRYQVIFNEKGYWDAISLDGKPVRLCYAGFDKCEAIGNIYESPELLGAIENAN